ncbi:MAG TPA: glycosyl hydrolase [Candidatus Angelobacter sp.]|nr:glycosyl hydrolase [Candidatus Angelobacter sp.]
MSCAAFIKSPIPRWISLLALTIMFAMCAFAQTSPTPQAEKDSGKKARKASKSEKAQTGHAAEQQPDAAKATSTESGDADQDEAKGPWHGLTWRLVGPFRGGRVLAVSGVVGDEHTYYFGGVGGGVWKTTDGGLSWHPLTDKVKGMSPSIGAIAVAPSDPNVIYAGTGEACIRGDIIDGNGVYKSIDAGKTWTYTGLRETRAIGRVAVNPKNPDIAFVAALGHPFGSNPERGIYRTTDGGKNWTKVLYHDEKSGGIDLSLDPSNPNVIFASLWQAGRTPWGLDSGGPGSGLYRSTDGGTTWKHLTGHGLPDGTLGRIGLAVAYSGNRVWALVEADKGGLFRSDDGGDNWTLTNSDRQYRQRAFYYTHVFADPRNPDGVYVLNTGMYRSNDGGKSFRPIRVPHGDNHGLWIDPNDPNRMIESNDGGANVSTNGGASWTGQGNQPTAEFYHVTTDNRFPYYLYGAQQDNSSVAIASAAPGGIDRTDWYAVGGGESGYIAPDPRDPEIVYAGSYGGEITRYDHRTEETKNVTPWPVNPIGAAAADQKYRFQWTEPIVFSPHDPKTLYFAAQVLFKSSDEGMSWQIISPDLTRNDKSKQVSSGGPITKDNTGVEVYDTIFSVVESPVQKDVIWAGSDDGLVHVTTDGGKNWANVTPKAMPEWGTVSMIEASMHTAGTAYVSVQRHKMDDFAPYVFKTTDFGKSWTAITNGIPTDAFVHAVREDRKRKGLLYAGTERGVFFSWDDGANWQSLQGNLPVSPVYDLFVQGNDLLAATHGRAFWILDDLSPLQQYKPEVANDEVHLYPPSPANHTQFGGGFFGGGGDRGQNPPGGAVIYYSLKTALKKAEKKADDKKPEDKKPETPAGSATAANAEGKEPGQANPANAPVPAKPEAGAAETAATAKNAPITLEILDQKGQVVRKFPPKTQPGEDAGDDEGFGARNANRGLPTDAGLNRFVWDMRYEGATRVPHSPLWAGSTDGPEALPGMYQVRLTVNGKQYTAPLEIKNDPRLKVTQQDLEKQFDLLIKIRERVTQAHETVNQIRDIRGQIAGLNKRLENQPQGKAVAEAGRQLDKRMTEVEEVLIQTKARSGQDVLNYPIRLNNYLVALGGVVESADSAPTQVSYEVFDMLSKQLDEQLAKWKQILATDVPAYNDTIRKQEVPAIILSGPAGGSKTGGN